MAFRETLRCGWILMACLALVTLGCAAAFEIPGSHPRPRPAVAKKPGPPPHAPAHGYRHKHPSHGIELVFDSGLGVYVVVDLEHVFYHAGHYYRWKEGAWSRSDRPKGVWKAVLVSGIPASLDGYAGSKGKSRRAKGPKHKSVPASHGHR